MTATCIYCGASGQLTHDHVPPRNLFRKPRPTLVTVPCCRMCNGAASKDDEYFRAVLALRQGSRESTDGFDARDATMRSMRREQGRGLTQLLLASARRVQRVSPSGQVLGPGISYPVDGRRLSRVAERVIRGLYYHSRREPLPSSHQASAYAEEGIQQLSEESRAELHQLVIQPALANAPLALGDGVFRCWHHFHPDDPRVSGWVLEFYGDMRMFGVTIPDDSVDTA